MKKRHPFPRLRSGLLLLCLLGALSPQVSAQELPESGSSVRLLLIGTDQAEGTSRSDAMILCTFQPEKDRLILTSLLRDLYVSIPGHESNRLNAAYALGGTALLKQTLQENLSVTVDGCLVVDFSGFATLVDLLGGVELELTQAEADCINAVIPGSLTSGKQWLTGEQALAYTRIRKIDPDGDFSRTRRQRKLLVSLLRRYQDTSPSRLLRTWKKALPLVSTDLSRRELLRLGSRLLPGLRTMEIETGQVPAEGTYQYKWVRDMSVIWADMDENRRILLDILG